MGLSDGWNFIARSQDGIDPTSPVAACGFDIEGQQRALARWEHDRERISSIFRMPEFVRKLNAEPVRRNRHSVLSHTIL